MTDIDTRVSNKALFTQEFKNVVETKNLWSPVATVLVSHAKVISSPFTSVSAAKAYQTDCVVPIGTQAVAVNDLTLDRHIGNAITDCKTALEYANFDVTSMFRRDLYASVIKKQNLVATADFVAGATAGPASIDLSTAEKVTAFLVGVGAEAESTVGMSTQIDGASVKRAEYHGKPFIAAGAEAFVAIKSKVAGMVSVSSLQSLNGDFIMSPFGVAIINLGAAADNSKRLIYGTAGVPVMAYREDMINVDMGELTSVTTAGATDLEVSAGDKLLQKTWFISAETKGKNGIYAQVASLITKSVMA